MCFTAIVYVRKLNDRVATFGVSGKLWRDALVMYDRMSGSLWSHISGVCIRGRFEEDTLRAIPSTLTTWEHWKTLHPGTKALKKPARTKSSSYKKYFSDRHRMGIFGTRNPDPTLEGKDLVLGVRVGDDAAAFPLDRLKKKNAVNYELDGAPLLVVYSKEGESARAFSREVKGDTLDFEVRKRTKAGPVLEDKATGSKWDGFTGRCVEGPLAGSVLTPVFSTPVFWFAWRNFFPTTEVY